MDDYESAWESITELIRGDESWSGRERNTCYVNNGDGTFSDISGAVGLDFIDDGRSVAAGDLDGDGDIDLVLKSRNEPGIRIVRNDWSDGESLTIRLVGTRSNRDAVGARVSLRTGSRLITRTVRAGSGFLSQHAKPLHFGIRKDARVDEARVTWPSGVGETLTGLQAGRSVVIVEGSGAVTHAPVAQRRPPRDRPTEAPPGQGIAAKPSSEAPTSSDSSGVWLIEPVPAPTWRLEDLNGKQVSLAEHRGRPLMVNVWATWCPPCRAELRDFQDNLGRFQAQGVSIAAISVDEPGSRAAVSDFIRKEGLQLPVFLANDRFVTAYNALRRHLLNRRSDLQVPTTLLMNGAGHVEKIYEGRVEAVRVLEDAGFLGEPSVQRLARALPMAGRFFGPAPFRDPTPLGAELLDVGLAEEAVPHFELGVSQRRNDPVAHFNLGTAYASAHSLDAARSSFAEALRLNPSYAEARNSLGVVFGRMGRHEEAILQFRAAIESKSGYRKALGNLATAYARTGNRGAAISTLERAIRAHPGRADLHQVLGLLHARHGDLEEARAWFDEALRVEPGDPESLVNLALLEAQRGNLGPAAARLSAVIRDHPGFDRAYLSLARVQLQTNNQGAARETLAELLRRHPGQAEALSLLATIPK